MYNAKTPCGSHLRVYSSLRVGAPSRRGRKSFSHWLSPFFPHRGFWVLRDYTPVLDDPPSQPPIQVLPQGGSSWPTSVDRDQLQSTSPRASARRYIHRCGRFRHHLPSQPRRYPRRYPWSKRRQLASPRSGRGPGGQCPLGCLVSLQQTRKDTSSPPDEEPQHRPGPRSLPLSPHVRREP